MFILPAYAQELPGPACLQVFPSMTLTLALILLAALLVVGVRQGYLDADAGEEHAQERAETGLLVAPAAPFVVDPPTPPPLRPPTSPAQAPSAAPSPPSHPAPRRGTFTSDIRAANTRVDGEDNYEPPYLPPPLPLPTSPLVPLVARAHAGCEREALWRSKRAATPYLFAVIFFPGRRTLAMRAAYSYAHPTPPHARNASSQGWAVGVGVAALRDSSPMPQMNAVPKTQPPRARIAAPSRSPAEIGVGVGIGAAALCDSSSTLKERRYDWMEDHRAYV
ncbi:hypothetical protein DFH09DRAFT_1362944 [Mycena vulgaris]|nr:hypothetical protein DFH09DRAFT_1362944 [Mycena vulgaris]